MERRNASGCDVEINRLAENKLSRYCYVFPSPNIIVIQPRELAPRFIRLYSLLRNTWRNWSALMHSVELETA